MTELGYHISSALRPVLTSSSLVLSSVQTSDHDIAQHLLSHEPVPYKPFITMYIYLLSRKYLSDIYLIDLLFIILLWSTTRNVSWSKENGIKA